MIEIPNTNAFIIAFILFCCFPIKNDTVIGIIGNTQGVKRPSSPAPKAIKKNTQSDESFSSVFSGDETSVIVSVAIVEVSSVFFVQL